MLAVALGFIGALVVAFAIGFAFLYLASEWQKGRPLHDQIAAMPVIFGASVVVFVGILWGLMTWAF